MQSQVAQKERADMDAFLKGMKKGGIPPPAQEIEGVALQLSFDESLWLLEAAAESLNRFPCITGIEAYNVLKKARIAAGRP